MKMKVAICLLIWCSIVSSDNVGWQKLFIDNIDEFHDKPLTWHDKTPLPEWLKGTFIRNGPARIKFNSTRRIFSSYLDGWAKLHSFKFDGSRVLYSGKMLEPPNYVASVKKGELTPQMTLNKFDNPDDEWTLMEKIRISGMAATNSFYDNSNPALWRLGPNNTENGIYMAVTDSPVATRFDIKTLATIGIEKPPGGFPVTVSGTTHYQREPNTDNSINIQLKMGLSKNYEILRYKPTDTYQKPEVIASIPAESMSYIHSFSITENYAIFYFYPFGIDATPVALFKANFHVFELMSGSSNKSDPTIIKLVNLKTGEITTRKTENMFSIHHGNAYENDQDEIIVDLCTAEETALRDFLSLKNVLNPPETWNKSASNNMGFKRYRISLKEDKVEVEKPEDVHPTDKFLNHFDFPIINENYRGKPYCIMYGWSSYAYTRQTLIKKNLCKPELNKTWTVENHYSGEFTFIPNPNAETEDDGVLVGIVFDGNEAQSYLLVIDGVSFEPINKAYLPHNIPWSAHGMWFPEAQF